MSFLGALGAVGRLLPGYVNGERQANSDNWNDLKNYNAVQAGQLQNIFDEQAMRDRLQMMRDNAMINNYQRWAAGLDLGVKSAQYPLMLGQIGWQAGSFFPMKQLQHQMLMRQVGMAMNPQAMQAKGQQGGALQQAMMGGLGGGWQYGLGGGYGYGGYGLGSRGGYGMMPSRY
jgi:hypothetical protein